MYGKIARRIKYIVFIVYVTVWVRTSFKTGFRIPHTRGNVVVIIMVICCITERTDIYELMVSENRVFLKAKRNESVK